MRKDVCWSRRQFLETTLGAGLGWLAGGVDLGTAENAKGETSLKSPITNCYEPTMRRGKLEVEKAYLYRPEKEWTYSHHPFITVFKGRFYAIWSNGRVNEDDLGQRVLISESSDFHSWSTPSPFVDSIKGKHSELVLTAAGFHQHGGKLVAYYAAFEYRPEDLQNGMRPRQAPFRMDVALRARTTKDARRWSEPLDLRLPLVPNHGPQRTKSGRLIISGGILYPYSDDPSGLTGWRLAGLIPGDLSKEVTGDIEYSQAVRERIGCPVRLCEGSFYQTDDGIIHMLLRSGTNRLWVTESQDDGLSWSKPRITDFTDNVAKFHFGRLPDGRFYYVGCPDPKSEWIRNPLVLSLSTDGVRFDRHFILADEPYIPKVPGLYKGGSYGYPHTMVHEERLYVIVSLGKESVAVFRVLLGQLG